MHWLVVALGLVLAMPTASGQGLVGMEKQVLPLTTQNWVAFRNFDGRQWIYFTHLVVYRCGLSQVRYSIGSDALDQTFALPPCDGQRPIAIDPVKYPPYLTMPLGTADAITVRVVYADGEESETVHLVPCEAPGDTSCAVLAE